MSGEATDRFQKSWDGAVDLAIDRRPGGYDASGARGDLMLTVEALEGQRISKIPRVTLIEGDVCETAPKFVADHPTLKISLLHLDVDLEAPTRCALEAFYPHMVQGGVIVFNGASDPDFPGESHATKKFFQARGVARPKLRSFHWHVPAPCWFVVE